MKYLLWVLGLFAAAVALTIASHNSGYVLLVLPPYRVELSLTLFISLLLLTFVLGYVLIRLSIGILQLPEYVRKFRSDRAQAKARKLLEEELFAFFEGRYADSENAANQAMELGDSSALHAIIAARSAHELREFKKRDAYLSAAKSGAGGDSTMRLITTGKFLIDQRDPQGTLNALHELRESGVKDHVGALSLELKAHQQANNWDEVLNVLYQLEKREGIDEMLASQIRQQAWLGKISQQQDLKGLTACVKSIPAELKKNRNMTAAAVRALIQNGGVSLALQLLTNSLNANWDSELVTLYGDCQTGDVVAQIDQAEQWLSDHKQDAGLLLTLGKLCLHQKLWGKARSYLEASNSIAPSQAAYTALGKLAESLGKTDEAFNYYQRAMSVANR